MVSQILKRINRALNEKTVATKAIKELEKDLVIVAKKHRFNVQASNEMGRGDELVIRFKKM